MLTLLVAAAMAVLLAGCGSSQREDEGSSQGSEQEEGSSQQTSEPTTNERLVDRCADSGSTVGQQEEERRGEVSNGKIAFMRTNLDGYPDIYVIDEEVTNETRLTCTAQLAEQGPAWSPDGEKIAFVRNARSIYVMNAVGANQTRLTGTSGAQSAETLGYPVWSPDGGKIAFVTIGPQSDRLSVMDADGTNRTQLNTFSGNVGHETYETTLSSPVWSPTGNKLAFGSTTIPYSESAAASASAPAPVEGLTGIYLINVDGTGLSKLTSSHELTNPVWSPDGQKIAFDDKGAINVINADGSGREELDGNTYVGFYSRLPQHAWSPDGQKIVFFCSGSDNGAAYLCVINADGTERTRLAREVSPGGYPLIASWGSG